MPQSLSKQSYSPSQEPLRRSYNVLHMQKNTHLSDTDKKIEEIKKKYDTPNRRQRISQLSAKRSHFTNKENENYGTADFRTKPFPNPSNATTEQQCLQQSKAVNRTDQHFYNKKSLLIAQNSQGAKSSFMRLSGYGTQTEEEFFKRVKEMKQSLLLNDTRNEVVGSLQGRESHTHTTFYNSNKTVEKDRIDNIDKINQKIKGILDCLNQNEKGRMKASHFGNPNIRDKANTQHSQLANSRQENLVQTPQKHSFIDSFKDVRQSRDYPSHKPSYHRQERSQLLQKIAINQNSNERRKSPQEDEGDKWEKLSSKLEKYEMENKNRLKQALDRSKVFQPSNNFQESSKDLNKNHLLQEKATKSFYDQRPSRFISATPLQKAPQALQKNEEEKFRDKRSKSFLTPHVSELKRLGDRQKSLHSRELSQKPEYQMRSGKKLEDEISKIQLKIQQFQEEKKRLGLNFKPFSYSNTKSTTELCMKVERQQKPLKTNFSESKIAQFTKSLYKNENILNKEKVNKVQSQLKKSTIWQNSTYLQNKQLESETNKETFRVRPDQQRQYSFDNSQKSEKQKSETITREIQIKLEKSNNSSAAKTSKFISDSSSTGYQQVQQEESYAVQHQTKEQIKQKSRQAVSIAQINERLRKKTNEGIQERKRKLQASLNSSQRKSEDLKTLVSQLCEQVKLDQQLRNAKLWYESLLDDNKEEKIRVLMPSKSIQEIKVILKVTESENNPFFTSQGYESSLQDLIKFYEKAERHWNERIYQKFDRISLENQGLNERFIDIEKKGFITLEDVVRFLNLQSGTFFRNRDLSLVFLRLGRDQAQGNKMQFETLLGTFCFDSD